MDLRHERFLRSWNSAVCAYGRWVEMKGAEKSPLTTITKAEYLRHTQEFAKNASLLYGYPHGVVGPSRVAHGE